MWGYDDYDRRSDGRKETDSIRHVSESRKRQPSPFSNDYGDYSGRLSPAGRNKIRRRDGGWDISPRNRSPTHYGSSYCSMRSGRDHDSWSERSCSRDCGKHRRSYSPGYLGRASPPPPLHVRPMAAEPVYVPREDDNDDDFSPDEPFIRAIDCLLREDLEVWNDYFKASAGIRACDIVKQYEMVTRMIVKWVGKRPPGFSRSIEEVNSLFFSFALLVVTLLLFF